MPPTLSSNRYGYGVLLVVVVILAGAAFRMFRTGDPGVPDEVGRSPAARRHSAAAEMEQPPGGSWGRERRVLAVSSAPASAEDMVAVCREIIARGGLRAESDDAKKLTASLVVLLAKGNPEAHELINSLPPGKYSDWLVARVFREWMTSPGTGRRSITELLALAAPISDPIFRRNAVEAAVREELLRCVQAGSLGMSRDELEALRKAPLSRQTMIDLVVRGVQFGLLDKKEILDAMPRSRPGEPFQIMDRAILMLPTATAGELLEEAARQGKDPEPRAFGRIAFRYAQDDPGAALAWSGRWTGEEMKSAVSGVMGHWLTVDPMAASTHVSALPAGSLKDAAASCIVLDCVRYGDQPTALRWLEAISSPERKEELKSVIRAIRKRD